MSFFMRLIFSSSIVSLMSLSNSSYNCWSVLSLLLSFRSLKVVRINCISVGFTVFFLLFSRYSSNWQCLSFSSCFFILRCRSAFSASCSRFSRFRRPPWLTFTVFCDCCLLISRPALPDYSLSMMLLLRASQQRPVCSSFSSN
jgi:hypothetical protein